MVKETSSYDHEIVLLDTVPHILYNDISIIMSYDKVIETSSTTILARVNDEFNKFGISFSVNVHIHFFLIRWN